MDRLLFVYPNVQGGVKTYVTNLTNELKNYNLNFKILTYSYCNSLFHRKIKNGNNYIELILSKSSTRQSQFKYLKSEIDLKDIIVCNDSFELEAINFLQLTNKLVYILHGDLKHYKSILETKHQLIDLVLCVSNGLKTKYQTFFSDLPFNICFPIVLINVQKKRFEARKFTCLFIGRFDDLKGADLFLDLINTCNQNIDWGVVTTRKGSDDGLINKLPMKTTLYYDIPNDQVLNLLQSSDVLIFPSRSEGFGIAILEALSSGVIPIVLDIPIGIPDQVINGYNGFIIKEENWYEASTYLKKLFSDKSLLTHMKENAILFAKEKFDSKTTVQQFLQAIKSCTISKQKKFKRITYNFPERYTPELIYRLLKIMNTKIKYG